MATNGGIAYIDQANRAVMVTNATGSLRRSLGGIADQSERAAWSPDGRRIVVGGRITDPIGGAVHPLPFPVHTPTWSPDSRRLAYIGDVQETIGTPDRHRIFGSLMMTPVDGSSPPLTVTGREFIGYPAWSPDGSTIAYSEDREGATATRIVLRDVSAGRERTIVPPQPGLPEVIMAAWAPTGDRLAFAIVPGQPPPGGGVLGQIAVIGVDGSGLRVLVSSQHHQLAFPCWSPDGQLIAYTEIHSFSDETHSFSTATVLVLPADGGPGRVVAPGSGSSWAVAREPTITIRAIPDPVVTGASLMVQTGVNAAVDGLPVPGHGTVSFTVDGAPAGSGSLSTGSQDISADTSVVLTAPSAGAHQIVANYPGDGEISSGTASLDTTVSRARPVVTITVLPNPSVVGAPVTVRVTVRGSAQPVGGSVRLFAGLTAMGRTDVVAGSAELAVTTLTDGLNQPIFATYAGDANNETAVSNIVHHDVQVPTRTTVAADVNPSVFGQPVRFRVGVSRGPGSTSGFSPAGTAAIDDDSTELGSATLSAGRTVIEAIPPVGVRAIRAVYRGDAVTAGSRSDLLAQTVTRADTTTTVAVAAGRGHLLGPAGRAGRPGSRAVSVPAGREIELVPTVTVVAPSAAVPAGRIDFTDQLGAVGAALGRTLYDGNRIGKFSGGMSVTLTEPGRHQISARFLGTDGLAGSAGSVVVDVGAAVEPTAPSGP